MRSKIFGAVLALLLGVSPVLAIQEEPFPPSPSDVYVTAMDAGDCGSTYIMVYIYDLDGDESTAERVDFTLPDNTLIISGVWAKGQFIKAYVLHSDGKVYSYSSEEVDALGSPCEIASALVKKNEGM